MNVYALGASQNIGYYTAIRLLAKGATITFLVRRPSVLEEDKTVKPYIQSGKVRLVKGDALSLEDVARGWTESIAASSNGRVDVVLFSIGGNLKINFLTGGKVNPRNLCSQSLLNLLCTIPTSLRGSPDVQPKFVVVTTTGATRSSHDRLPLAMKIFYWWLLVQPHTDKFNMERVLARCDGTPWTDDDGYREDFLPQGWKTAEGMPVAGSLSKILVVRPAFLTNGLAKGDGPPGTIPAYWYREAERGSEGYTISRGDVAHFIAEVALADDASWERFGGKRVSLSY